MNQNGLWRYNSVLGAAALSAQDILNAIPVFNENATILQHQLQVKEDSDTTLQEFAIARLTVHLREAVLYLQLQSQGHKFPAIEENRLGCLYPFFKMEKHQEDALFEHFEGQELFNPNTGSSCPSRREDYEPFRNLGLIPYIRWE